MIGPRPTIEDIVLDLTPDVVDLYCHEQLPDSSEDEDEDEVDHHQARHHHQQARPAEPQCYRIVTSCNKCEGALRLVVVTTHEQVLVLQQMLMGPLEIVCPGCAGRV
ncbi:E7 [Macaca fascicularis papillomavirus 7]|uniref:Protein E7 n=1 Tax=Macaca fascicularis papillomavirus 7 TaxID=471185 RepID=C3PU65_RHPV1|nr:E7 [Macaca fascicularis papillomavirus 7]